jgi:hypothetical protein
VLQPRRQPSSRICYIKNEEVIINIETAVLRIRHHIPSPTFVSLVVVSARNKPKIIFCDFFTFKGEDIAVRLGHPSASRTTALQCGDGVFLISHERTVVLII